MSGINSVAQKPKISIITVVLNGIEFIEGYLDNVLPVLNEQIELIIIDGKSTDGTVTHLQKHSAQINYWSSEPDEGIYAAMNKGIADAKGDWLYFMGIDDRLMEGFGDMPNKLQDQNTIYYGNVISYGKLMAKVYDAYFLTKINICHQALFYPRSIFDKYLYDTRYKVYADYHLNLQCWKDPAIRFKYVDLLIASFPPGGFSSYTQDETFEQDRDQLFKNYLGRKAYYRYLYRTKGVWKALKQLTAHG